MVCTTLVPVFVPRVGLYLKHVQAAIASPALPAKKAM